MITSPNRARELAERFKDGRPMSAKLKCDYLLALEECAVSAAIVEKVEKMREAQRQYFKTRSSDWLEKSKALERDVDRMIAEENDPQADLFK